MIWLFYNLLLTLLSPVAAGYLLYRLMLRGKSREGLGERLGAAPVLGPPGPDGRVWIHAVSAGETVAAAPVVRELRARAPELEVIVSSITPAGHAQARRLIPEASRWFYFPFDFVWCVERALSRAHPDVFVAVETEIWPNFLHAARRRGVRTVLINGRFSDRGFRRAARLRPLYRWALASVERFAMQSALDRERGIVLGALPERLQVVGNTKFDQNVPQLSAEEAAAARATFDWEPGRPLWIAGSTHPGEEEQILDAYTAVRHDVPDLTLMIAPRHVERADEIEALIRARGMRVMRRTGVGKAVSLPSESLGQADSLLHSVALLDTVGELAGFYALADVVFVGGSLIPKGGHDILQPLFHGKPTLFGPHMHNQRDMTTLALAAGAVLQVADADELAHQVRRLLTDTPARTALRAGAERLLAANRGAAQRSAEVILEMLDERAPGVRRWALGVGR
jgi:3-deoxy-D-manno-octulosonic-acid transferase